MRKKPKRLVINLPEIVYDDLKSHSEERHMSMSAYILAALVFRLEAEPERINDE